MASKPENMRVGVRYYVTLTRGMIVGTYLGFERNVHLFLLVDGKGVAEVPNGNIIGASARRS